MCDQALTVEQCMTSMQDLFQDEAYLLESYGVVGPGGERTTGGAAVLLTSSLADKEGGYYTKYVDPRWHLGARLLRPTRDGESYHWGSELKWRRHAHKLGLLPGAHAVSKYLIMPREADLHTKGLIDAAPAHAATAQELAGPVDTWVQAGEGG